MGAIKIDEEIRQWKQATDAASVLLTYGSQRHIIAEVTIEEGSYLRFAAMSAKQKSHLTNLSEHLTLQDGRVTREMLASACQFAAGISFQEAQARRLVDTPETRAQARAQWNI